MLVLRRLALVVVGGVLLAGAEPKTRSFHCTYEAVITGLPAGKAARIWLPVPPSNAQQEVTLAKRQLPGEGKMGTEKKCGNRVLFVEGQAGADGTIPLVLHYRVQRRAVQAGGRAEAEVAEDLSRFLAADSRIPVGGKPARLLEGRALPEDSLELGRALFDLVNEHMRYSKEGTGWGQGDAVWACDSRYGNCTDFHSLFISLARTRKLPAKFEIGFLLPDKRGAGTVAGYHCWAYFRSAKSGWVPVDISEANKDPRHKDDYFGKLSENRVTFSAGRDLVLVPPQDGPPLNFFLVPYVEVDRKPYPAARVKLHFRYEDIPARKEKQEAPWR